MSRNLRRSIGRHRPFQLVWLVAAPPLALLVAGCGGSSSGDVASLSNATTTTVAKATKTSTDPADAGLEFARCMRDNGVTTFPDPQTSGSGTFGFRVSGPDASSSASETPPIDPSDPTFQAAQEKCFPILQNSIPQGTPDIDPELEDKLNQMTKCMRDAGFDIGDMVFVGKGSTSGPVTNGSASAPSKPNFDPNDPAFEAAQRDCATKAGLNPPEGAINRGQSVSVAGGK